MYLFFCIFIPAFNYLAFSCFGVTQPETTDAEVWPALISSRGTFSVCSNTYAAIVLSQFQSSWLEAAKSNSDHPEYSKLILTVLPMHLLACCCIVETDQIRHTLIDPQQGNCSLISENIINPSTVCTKRSLVQTVYTCASVVWV